MFNAPVEPKSLENRLVQWVEHEIENGNPVCIRAHAGRLQYVMSILSSKIHAWRSNVRIKYTVSNCK